MITMHSDSDAIRPVARGLPGHVRAPIEIICWLKFCLLQSDIQRYSYYDYITSIRSVIAAYSNKNLAMELELVHNKDKLNGLVVHFANSAERLLRLKKKQTPILNC